MEIRVGDELIHKPHKSAFNRRLIRIEKIEKGYYYWSYFDFETSAWIYRENNSSYHDIAINFVPNSIAGMVLYGSK